MSMEEFVKARLHEVIPADKVLFEEEIHSTSALYNDRSGNKLRQKLLTMFPPPFPFSIQQNGLAELRRLLWPEVRLATVTEPQRKQDEQRGILRLLDSRQESLARRLDAPKAIIHGPAGSGKSIVLVHKAIAEFNRLKGAEGVLLVCYNLTLVHYLKRLLAEYGAPLGSKGIRVMHFYDFCHSLVQEKIAYEKEDTDYYKMVCDAALEVAPNTQKLGAILVDEGQDFSDAMMQVLLAVGKPEGLFWVAMDLGQELYHEDARWRRDVMFRQFTLQHPYRASLALTQYCEKLLRLGNADCTNKSTENGTEAEQAPDIFAAEQSLGIAPIFVKIHSAVEQAKSIASTIRELHESGVPYAEMRILYASKKIAGVHANYPEFLADYLENEGVLCSWVSQDASSKMAWDCTTERVAISTIHSMKGLDATVIFVCGLDALEQTSIPWQNLVKLAYVACTRARESLYVFYEQETPIILSLKDHVAS